MSVFFTPLPAMWGSLLEKTKGHLSSFPRGSPLLSDEYDVSSQSRVLNLWLTLLWSIRKQNKTSLLKNCDLGKIYRDQSIQFNHSVVSDSLQPHESQHARPGVHSNPCPSSRWCHPNNSSSVVPFSSCPQFFPASGSFQMTQLFASGGQSIGVSVATSELPMNTQDWSPLRYRIYRDNLLLRSTVSFSIIKSQE